MSSEKEIFDLPAEKLLSLVKFFNKMASSDLIDMFNMTYKDGEPIEYPEFDLILSIRLFTGESVRTVRDPSEYNSEFARKIQKTNPEVIPTKRLYEKANKILTKLASVKNEKANFTIYRGISLDENVVKLLRPGMEFNNWSISSWSTSYQKAQAFGAPTKEGHVRVILKIENPGYGCDIHHLSLFVSEEEFILGKKLIIEKIDFVDNRNKFVDGKTHYQILCKVLD